MHPALATFDSLLALRNFQVQQPQDGGAIFARFCAEHINVTKSQLFQDVMVLLLSSGKRNGYFVEFGATDGINLSNTYLLESRLQWKGILAEPARCWHERLKKSRSAAIDTRCVWTKTGETLKFFEAGAAEFSTLDNLRDHDFNKDNRQVGTSYDVESVSLNDLLASHNAPAEIDYMSVDTEGSEFPILNAFDFDKYHVKIITVEHNFREPDRQNIFDLLSAKGFARIFEPFSKVDDWYVQQSVLDTL